METKEQKEMNDFVNLFNVIHDEDGNLAGCEVTPEGRECQFLTFLEHAYNFAWMKEEMGEKLSPEENRQKSMHLMSKLCALGYLMIKRKEKEKSKAVILVGGQGSGIGIFLEMLTYARNVEYVDGDRADLCRYLQDWPEKNGHSLLLIDIVIVDNVNRSFDLSCLFSHITGKWPLKILKPYGLALAFEKSPKIIVTTKHPLNGTGASYTDRQWVLYFSDFNAHNPIIDYYGDLFFDDWNADQWNHAFTLLAECMKLYLRYGFIQASGEHIEKEEMRQYMGESFMSWADKYFSDPRKRNMRLIRKEVQDNFFRHDPLQRKFISSSVFKKKLKKYCAWKGYLYNPHMGDTNFDDRSGGIEYLLIGDRDEAK